MKIDSSDKVMYVFLYSGNRQIAFCYGTQLDHKSVQDGVSRQL